MISFVINALPEAGTKGIALGRNGKEVCKAEVVSVKSNKAFDKTNLLTTSLFIY